MGVPKYILLLWKNKTYVPTIGRQMIKEYVCGGKELVFKFRKKVVRFALQFLYILKVISILFSDWFEGYKIVFLRKIF